MMRTEHITGAHFCACSRHVRPRQLRTNVWVRSENWCCLLQRGVFADEVTHFSFHAFTSLHILFLERERGKKMKQCRLFLWQPSHPVLFQVLFASWEYDHIITAEKKPSANSKHDDYFCIIEALQKNWGVQTFFKEEPQMMMWKLPRKLLCWLILSVVSCP